MERSFGFVLKLGSIELRIGCTIPKVFIVCPIIRNSKFQINTQEGEFEGGSQLGRYCNMYPRYLFVFRLANEFSFLNSE